MAIFCAGKNTLPYQAACLLKKFMALSILKLEKSFKLKFIAKYLNKKCYFINFSLALKLLELLKDVNIKL